MEQPFVGNIERLLKALIGGRQLARLNGLKLLLELVNLELELHRLLVRRLDILRAHFFVQSKKFSSQTRTH